MTIKAIENRLEKQGYKVTYVIRNYGNRAGLNVKKGSFNKTFDSPNQAAIDFNFI